MAKLYVGNFSRWNEYVQMLKLIPKNWLTWDFIVTDGVSPIAEIDDHSWWREKGILLVQGSTYKVYQEGLMSGAFLLESSGSILARAEKPSVFHRSFDIEYEQKFYTLRADLVVHRKFVLIDGDRKVGWLRPDGPFTR